MWRVNVIVCCAVEELWLLHVLTLSTELLSQLVCC